MIYISTQVSFLHLYGTSINNCFALSWIRSNLILISTLWHKIWSFTINLTISWIVSSPWPSSAFHIYPSMNFTISSAQLCPSRCIMIMQIFHGSLQLHILMLLSLLIQKPKPLHCETSQHVHAKKDHDLPSSSTTI